MNNIELKQKVHSATYSILKERNYIAPVDMLMSIGVLSVKDYENWRFGRVPYLEQAVVYDERTQDVRSAESFKVFINCI